MIIWFLNFRFWCWFCIVFIICVAQSFLFQKEGTSCWLVDGWYWIRINGHATTCQNIVRRIWVQRVCFDSGRIGVPCCCRFVPSSTNQAASNRSACRCRRTNHSGCYLKLIFGYLLFLLIFFYVFV